MRIAQETTRFNWTFHKKKYRLQRANEITWGEAIKNR